MYNASERNIKMYPQSTVLIWDWDGTLLNTRPAFEQAFTALQTEFPCPYFTLKNFEVLLKNWGAFWENCPLPPEERTAAMQFYGATYKKVNTTASRLMPYAQEVLSEAQKAGFNQILVSNKIQWAIEAEVEHFGLTNCFSKIQGVEKGLHPDKKPSRSYGEKALEGLRYDTLIVIGDSTDDITFANNLNAKCLYLGTNPFPDLNRQNVNTLTDVQTVLKNLSAPHLPLQKKSTHQR